MMAAHATSPRFGPRGALAITVALVAFAPAASLACGACVEDKVAATYDHGVVEQAAANGDVMVFCEVAGSLDAQRLRQVVRRVHGVKPQSVRVSAQPAALSFAVDPRAHSPRAAVEAAQRSLVPGTRLTIVRLRQPVAAP
ncbi:MAG: hypothetical protein ABWZ88_15780 [Variovorax sp.]